MKLTDLEPEHTETGDIRVIVETPKGARIKCKYLPEHDLFAVNRLIPVGMLFPFNSAGGAASTTPMRKH